jgi:protein-S-isoprenylcysteine O-methyltransferase Ste14
LDVQDKIYYLRTILAAIAGSILGIIIKPHAVQSNTIGITIVVGIIFYIVSYIIAKELVGNIPKDKKRKLITNGIFAFIFMLLTFMVIIFTVINQHNI